VSDRDDDCPHLDLDREAWRRLRAGAPMPLTAAEVDELREHADPIGLSEIEDIYLPLSRMIWLYYDAAAALRESLAGFLAEQMRPVPFIVAVAGSVAAGKSTTARVLSMLIEHWPQRPRTALVPTDNFLHPNAVLEQRGLTDRKGFPESYDRAALLRFAREVKAGATEISAPVYSHRAYDIVPGESLTVQRPDVLILEGVNVLQADPRDSPALADLIDFSVYVDAQPDDIRQWFLVRLRALRHAARTDPGSAFRPLTQVSDDDFDVFGIEVWKTINEVNLIENIQPTRARATLVLHKAADHTVNRVRLRRF
jgi:type I pantothenate kinase